MSPLSLRVADRADRAAIKVYNANEKIGDIHDVVLDLREGRGRHPLAWTVVAVDYDKAIRRIATAIRDCQKDDPILKPRRIWRSAFSQRCKMPGFRSQQLNKTEQS